MTHLQCPHPTTSNTPWGWDPSTQPPPPPQPYLQTSDPSVSLAQKPLHTRAPLHRSLFHHPQSEDTSHFLLFIQNNRFKYNLRTPPSTGVCLCFPPLPPPNPRHALMDTAWGYLGGREMSGGCGVTKALFWKQDTTTGPCFHLGQRGNNETGPL